jgi:hypothetical protein
MSSTFGGGVAFDAARAHRKLFAFELVALQVVAHAQVADVSALGIEALKLFEATLGASDGRVVKRVLLADVRGPTAWARERDAQEIHLPMSELVCRDLPHGVGCERAERCVTELTVADPLPNVLLGVGVNRCGGIRLHPQVRTRLGVLASCVWDQLHAWNGLDAHACVSLVAEPAS